MGGHRTVGHDGIWKGFLSAMVLAPDDGLGVLAFANTGRFRPGGAPDAVADAVLRSLLDVPGETVPGDVPEDPVTWSELCGWYSLGPGVLTDPQPRMLFGAGVDVLVSRGHLTVGVPLLPGGVRLHPDGDHPDLFHADLSAMGAGIASVVFGRDRGGQVTTLYTHLGDQPIAFHKRPAMRNPRPWVTGALAAGAAALALRRRRGPRSDRVPPRGRRS